MALTLAQMVANARSQAREISPTQAAQARNDAELSRDRRRPRAR